MIKKLKIQWIGMALCFFVQPLTAQTKIDRKAVVERHQVQNTSMDTLASLSVGNGQFAYTVDATGMQSFPETYQNGIPLSTQSEWGWNSFENTENYRIEESYSAFDQYGRKVDYCIQLKTPERSKGASEWFRQNVHRLQLGNLGLEITKKDGSLALA